MHETQRLSDEYYLAQNYGDPQQMSVLKQSNTTSPKQIELESSRCSSFENYANSCKTWQSRVRISQIKLAAKKQQQRDIHMTYP